MIAYSFEQLVQMISNSKRRPVVLKQISRTPGKERWRGSCPFGHRDSDPSFDVFRGSDGKARFYCHSCHEKGDGADWLQRVDGMTPREAGVPMAPDPEIARQRIERVLREAAIRVWRDSNPDSAIPDWGVAL